MYGAILGDMIGSIYEWRPHKSKSFELFSMGNTFTDDSVMTIAVAEGFMFFERDHGRITDTSKTFESIPEADISDLERYIIRSMKFYGSKYPHAGYGGRFSRWLRYGTKPYNSWGNGSAMRTSSVGWIFDDLDMVRKMAALQASVTHNHPEGIKGAEAISSAIFMARKGSSKNEIKEYIEKEFSYDLDRTCDEIRPDYKFDVSCQGSVPEAIIAFLESEDFVDAIRNAISLGGDSDTIGAMTGSIAEAFYGVPDDLITECENLLPSMMLETVREFHRKYML